MASLEPAPDGPLRHSGYRPRITPGPDQRPCTTCGKPAVATRRMPGEGGLAWVDSCRDCMVTAMRAGES